MGLHSSTRYDRASPESSMQLFSLYAAVNSALSSLERKDRQTNAIQAFPESVSEASTDSELQRQQQQVPQSVPPAVLFSPSSIPENPKKRKASFSNHQDPLIAQIRETIFDHLNLLLKKGSATSNALCNRIRDPLNQYNQANKLVTISYQHASVAQKSYGAEKRYLCPPPLISITGNTGSILGHSFSVQLAITNEQGQHSNQVSENFAERQSVAFRSLHISSSIAAKAKSFNLNIDVISSSDDVLAQMVTKPINIISKPSKKGSKNRVSNSTLMSGAIISLYNRINSQTVRTKYMSVANGRFCLRNESWTPLQIRVYGASESSFHQPIMYGSQVVLYNERSGIVSDPLYIHRVDKDQIAPDDGYLGQMHRIVLRRGQCNNEPNVLKPYANQQGMDFVQPLFLGATTAQEKSTTGDMDFPVELEPATSIDESGSIRVSDAVCWTVIGISHYEFSMMNALNARITQPITPFPVVETSPKYIGETHSLELLVSGCTPKTQVWLGPYGPLAYTRQETEKADENLLIVSLPYIEVNTTNPWTTLPLLFTRPNGLIYVGKCDVVVR
ncbi:CBF1/Su(H)/LAG-1 family transcription factor Cbf11 [Schizosaccharomyces japonicus yFS275]|uniref:CBF1/Su(H)/LAG-1 family transcription factor Cbf11 n=1 Tax=Schizosaccharomyces japonicus (strain yFS275 / FY16936) TaxID=402676 RepID=B6K5W7_SCHJY|nr:CBF1/Su(H)/LAG-1 family transcription factor Cbf11 [Schizosaccharomyces japonicus yFS275]EEB08921.1 CBF1/Su(H)/LAG-1 family transcription factor Cbf11 [Schizosaccharomyces japonicus yFS275]